jgi:hypothetical protein
MIHSRIIAIILIMITVFMLIIFSNFFFANTIKNTLMAMSCAVIAAVAIGWIIE